jgi:hypothetical protein
MKREEIIEQGMRLLSDVHDNEHFRTVDGRTLRSVRELVLLLETFQDEHFRHHVNEHRNDFAAWIEHSVGDATLADRIKNARSRQDIQRAIAHRLEELENDLLTVERAPVREERAHKTPKPTAREAPKPIVREAPKVRTPEPLPDEQAESAVVERDELLEEIERSIAQARAQLEVERAQEVRDAEDLSGEPEEAIVEEPEEPAPKKRLVKEQRAAKEKRTNEQRNERAQNKAASKDAQGGFSLKDFFIGFAFGSVIGGVLGAIIGLVLL